MHILMLGCRELREHTKYGFSKNPQSPRNDTEKDLKKNFTHLKNFSQNLTLMGKTPVGE